MKIVSVIALGFALAACNADEKGAPGAGSYIQKPALAKCPVIDSSSWTAWVDAEPGPDAPTLHVRGTVVLPTPGYDYAWRVGIADRALPPGQHMHLEFTPPDGPVAQVITTADVAYAGEAAYPEYRAIIIRCGDEKLAEIPDVPIAH